MTAESDRGIAQLDYLPVFGRECEVQRPRALRRHFHTIQDPDLTFILSRRRSGSQLSSVRAACLRLICLMQMSLCLHPCFAGKLESFRKIINSLASCGIPMLSVFAILTILVSICEFRV